MRFFFFVDQLGPPNAAIYQHTMIAFAEGLNECSMTVDSNNDYYKYKDGRFLFNKTTVVDFDDYDFLVLSPPTPHVPSINKLLTSENRKFKTVFIDHSDGFHIHHANTKKYDYYFRTSFHADALRKLTKDTFEKIHPFAFYLTNRMIDNTYDVQFKKRSNLIFNSFRVNHQFRNVLDSILKLHFPTYIRPFNDSFSLSEDKDSEEYLNWHQSGRRHNKIFYKELSEQKICNCVGGTFFNSYASQIDSFRLWEAFASGSCVLSIDFDYFGIKLPVQPVNMEHYVGIRLEEEHDKKIIDDMLSGKIDIEKIASTGKKWALENYSPKSCAKYIISIISP